MQHQEASPVYRLKEAEVGSRWPGGPDRYTG
jgi:hypothetical protein